MASASSSGLRRGSNRESVAASSSRNRAYSVRGTNSPPLRKPSSRSTAAAGETRRTERTHITTTTVTATKKRSPVKQDFRSSQRSAGYEGRRPTAATPPAPPGRLPRNRTQLDLSYLFCFSLTMASRSLSRAPHGGALRIQNLGSPVVVRTASKQSADTAGRNGR
ncbi:hypothetical protein K440DRAFT_73531 [Wilcoxina mikolae CBS 423.85]|nr:hypothetical protein K440DRAFT_73531 [Wilcoxina mikolae CBS 423.85]